MSARDSLRALLAARRAARRAVAAAWDAPHDARALDEACDALGRAWDALRDMASARGASEREMRCALRCAAAIATLAEAAYLLAEQDAIEQHRQAWQRRTEQRAERATAHLCQAIEALAEMLAD